MDTEIMATLNSIKMRLSALERSSKKRSDKSYEILTLLVDQMHANRYNHSPFIDMPICKNCNNLIRSCCKGSFQRQMFWDCEKRGCDGYDDPFCLDNRPLGECPKEQYRRYLVVKCTICGKIMDDCCKKYLRVSP